MAKRMKKPPVPPEVRNKWLKRKEEFGETAPQIAEADGFDVRTVRKHLKTAAQERDYKVARISFVKETLEKHHQDMIEFANDLLAQVTAERQVSLDFTDDLRLVAMKQHLANEPLWVSFKKWNELLGSINETTEDAKKRIELSLQRSKLKSISSNEADNVIEAAAAFLFHQFVSWARKHQGLNLENDWVTEEKRDGEISVRCGFSHFGWIKEKELDVIRNSLKLYEKRIIKYSQFNILERYYSDLITEGEKIRTELKGIILRRILPGRCNYCPI